MYCVVGYDQSLYRSRIMCCNSRLRDLPYMTENNMIAVSLLPPHLSVTLSESPWHLRPLVLDWTASHFPFDIQAHTRGCLGWAQRCNLHPSWNIERPGREGAASVTRHEKPEKHCSDRPTVLKSSVLWRFFFYLQLLCFSVIWPYLNRGCGAAGYC